jgi:hypothetical protein
LEKYLGPMLGFLNIFAKKWRKIGDFDSNYVCTYCYY